MIFDFATGDREAFVRVYDVCVVGSGPAGLTLARKLAARGLTVALMEGGGLEPEAESQALYEGENLGLDYFALDATRLRYFGGTSGHWGGWCPPLDAVDFEARPGVPLSGWPIGKAELDRYGAEADAVIGLAAVAPRDVLGFVDPTGAFEEIVFRFVDPPTRFGTVFRDEVAAAERLHLFLGANLVDIRLVPDLGAVEGLLFRARVPGDPGTLVRARRYALCLGGLETPRALLNATGQMAAGVGNGYDQVGRHFCEHPTVIVGEALFESPDLRPTRETPEGPKAFYAPTPAHLAARESLNFCMRLVPDYVPFEASALKSAARDAACLGPDFGARLAARVLGAPLRCDNARDAGHVKITTEQVLNPDSRVLLTEARDAFGLRRLALDWRLTPQDYANMRVATQDFGATLAAAGIGRVRMADWLMAESPVLPGTAVDEVGGNHHLCTARMSADPRTGVVDAECRVHGIPDLHLCGGAVFATPGWANPTYTIVQLALRLADRIAADLVG
jgi:choline dehydrogenase-like flavoprotein